MDLGKKVDEWKKKSKKYGISTDVVELLEIAANSNDPIEREKAFQNFLGTVSKCVEMIYESRKDSEFTNYIGEFCKTRTLFPAFIGINADELNDMFYSDIPLNSKYDPDGTISYTGKNSHAFPSVAKRRIIEEYKKLEEFWQPFLMAKKYTEMPDEIKSVISFDTINKDYCFQLIFNNIWDDIKGMTPGERKADILWNRAYNDSISEYDKKKRIRINNLTSLEDFTDPDKQWKVKEQINKISHRVMPISVVKKSLKKLLQNLFKELNIKDISAVS